jgi:putative FmdB family regulatory protein
MPVYEYQCQACSREFEYQQRMADPEKTVCEACGGALERLISRTAFQLKGGGWYKDLYASSKPGDSGSSASPTTSESKPAESKPASDAGSASSGTSGTSSGGTSGTSSGGTSGSSGTSSGGSGTSSTSSTSTASPKSSS